MTSHDPDQKKPVDEKIVPAIAQKMEALQERIRKMGPLLMVRTTRRSWTKPEAKTAVIQEAKTLKRCAPRICLQT